MDWEPLRPSDPTPGDPDEVAALARRYSDTAAAIADQAASLRKLASQATGGWKGKAGSAFHEKAVDLSDRIAKAQRRYSGAGQALSAFATAMRAAQEDADRALRMAKDAHAAMQANAPDAPPPPGSPPPTAEEKAAATRKQAHYSDAQSSLQAAQRLVDSAEHDYQTAAHRAATQIHDASSHDGLTDGWWDRNAGWIKTALKIIGVVVLILTIAALIVSLAVPGLNIFGGVLLADLLMNLATAGTALMLAGHIGLYLSGHGSMTDIVLDVIGLATFGLAKIAGPLVGAMARSGRGVAATVAGARAGRAFMVASGKSGMLYTLAERIPLADTVMSFFPSTGRALTGARAAATDTKAVVSALEAGDTSRMMTLMSGGDLKLAEGMTLLNKVNTQVPHVLRVGARVAVAGTMTATMGSFNYSNLAANTVATGQSLLVEPGQEAGTEASIAQISDHYSNPVITVP